MVAWIGYKKKCIVFVGAKLSLEALFIFVCSLFYPNPISGKGVMVTSIFTCFYIIMYNSSETVAQRILADTFS